MREELRIEPDWAIRLKVAVHLRETITYYGFAGSVAAGCTTGWSSNPFRTPCTK